MKALYLVVVALGMSLVSYCQTQTMKTVVLDQSIVVEKLQSLVITADTLIFAPVEELFIEGVLEIRSPYILLAPKVQIKGGGTIRIVSPNSVVGNSFPLKMPTVIDGNGNRSVKVNIELWNTDNLVLGKLIHPFLDEGNLDCDDLCVGSNLSSMVDGACVELRGNHFILAEHAKLNYFSPSRMFISNGNINSTVSKWLSANSIFEFPIGIEKGDYSPVTVKPEKEAELFVSVVRHSVEDNDMEFAKKSGGINRVWGVYADNNIRTTYIFRHNELDEGDEVRSSDIDIFQYSDANQWKLMTTSYLGNEQHSTKNLASMLTKVPVNYFSKFGKVRGKPRSNDDHVSVKQGESIVIPVLKNDKPGEGKIILEDMILVERPKNGFAEVLPSGEVRYQPFDKFSGADSLVYELVDEYGFKSQSTVFIAVSGDGLFLLSNVLTPNGDGYNDHLVFVNKDLLASLELTIVNRWGDRLYESKNYQNTWDGGSLSGGTYYYIIKGKRMDGEDFHQKGWILLNK